MNVTEKSIVSPSNYAEIKKMLLGEEADVNLALTILEQSSYEESKVYILCVLKECFKETFGSGSKFKELAPELADVVIASISTSDADITKLVFKEIYDIAIKRDNKVELEFILDILKDELVALLGEFGYDFINFTDVMIKPKGWEKETQKILTKLQAND